MKFFIFFCLTALWDPYFGYSIGNAELEMFQKSIDAEKKRLNTSDMSGILPPSNLMGFSYKDWSPSLEASDIKGKGYIDKEFDASNMQLSDDINSVNEWLNQFRGADYDNVNYAAHPQGVLSDMDLEDTKIKVYKMLPKPEDGQDSISNDDSFEDSLKMGKNITVVKITINMDDDLEDDEDITWPFQSMFIAFALVFILATVSAIMRHLCVKYLFRPKCTLRAILFTRLEDSSKGNLPEKKNLV